VLELGGSWTYDYKREGNNRETRNDKRAKECDHPEMEAKIEFRNHI